MVQTLAACEGYFCSPGHQHKGPYRAAMIELLPKLDAYIRFELHALGNNERTTPEGEQYFIVYLVSTKVIRIAEFHKQRVGGQDNIWEIQSNADSVLGRNSEMFPESMYYRRYTMQSYTNFDPSAIPPYESASDRMMREHESQKIYTPEQIFRRVVDKTMDVLKKKAEETPV